MENFESYEHHVAICRRKLLCYNFLPRTLRYLLSMLGKWKILSTFNIFDYLQLWSNTNMNFILLLHNSWTAREKFRSLWTSHDHERNRSSIALKMIPEANLVAILHHKSAVFSLLAKKQGNTARHIFWNVQCTSEVLQVMINN